jgi:hypothetical protein
MEIIMARATAISQAETAITKIGKMAPAVGSDALK